MKIVDIEPLHKKYEELYQKATRSGKTALAELLRIVLQDIEKVEEKDVLVLGERYPSKEYKFAMWSQSDVTEINDGVASIETVKNEFAVLRCDPEEEDLPDE